MFSGGWTVGLAGKMWSRRRSFWQKQSQVKLTHASRKRSFNFVFKYFGFWWNVALFPIFFDAFIFFLSIRLWVLHKTVWLLHRRKSLFFTFSFGKSLYLWELTMLIRIQSVRIKYTTDFTHIDMWWTNWQRAINSYFPVLWRSCYYLCIISLIRFTNVVWKSNV